MPEERMPEDRTSGDTKPGNAAAVEQLRWKKLPVLSDGFVCLVDTMGSDESVVQAARADFDAAESPVVLVRLVWIGIAEFMASYAGQSFGVVQVLGTDRVVFETLPAARASSSAVKERLLAFGAFVAGAAALGLIVAEAGPRLAFELGWLALGSLYWMIRRDRDIGGAR